MVDRKPCRCPRVESCSWIRFKFLWLTLFAALLTFGCSTAKVQVTSRGVLQDQEQAPLQIQTDYPETQIIYTTGGEVILGNLAEELAEEPRDEEDRTEPQLNNGIMGIERFHKEELVGTLWLSVPEPELLEDPLLEDYCIESAQGWCDPDFEDEYLAYLEQEKKLKFEASIFPNFVSPVDEGLVLRGMQLPKKGRRGHYGLDIIPASWEGRGTPIKAVEDGFVVRQGRVRGYGYYVVIYHQSGIFSLYSHLLKNKLVNVGQQVERGEIIAHMGKSGNARGYHLHFELIDLREHWDFSKSVDEFIEELWCNCVEKLEFNQFSKLLFSKEVKTDPLPSIPGLGLTKRINGKWVAVTE